MKCLNCNAELTGAAMKFCNAHCRAEYEWKQKKQAMLQSGVVPTSGRINETDRRIARKLLEETVGHKCSICGISEWMGKPITLIVDHIDGNPSNSQISNLRLVCSNCDSQLITYKNRRGIVGREQKEDSRAARKRDEYTRYLKKLGFERTEKLKEQSVCPVCNKHFEKKKSTQVCCSRACANKLMSQKNNSL